MDSIHTGQKFTWDAVAGAVAYDFQILNTSLGAVLADRPNLAVLEVTMEDVCAGLSIGVTYNAHVRAKDSFGVGQWSAPMSFQIVGPPIPTNLRIV